jgi:hypothetical protein
MCSLRTVLDFELFTRRAGPDNRYQAVLEATAECTAVGFTFAGAWLEATLEPIAISSYAL